MNPFRIFSRLWRVGLWLVTTIAVLLLLLVVGVALYSRTAHFHQFLHEQILAVLQDSLDAEVSFEETTGSIWQGLELHNLSIRKDGVEVISLPLGVVSVDLFSQLAAAVRTSSIQVAKITLSQPVVRLVQDAKAGWNIDRLMKQSEPTEQSAGPLPISILLPRLVIENGRVSARLADGKEFQVSALTFNGEAKLSPTGMQVDVNTLQLGASGTGIPDSQLDSSLAYADADGLQTVTLRSVDVRTAASHLQISGALKNLAKPEVEVQIAVNKLAAADVALMAPPQRLRQDVSGSIHIAGPLSDLHVDTILAAADGHVTSTVTANLSQSPPEAQGTVTVKRFVIHKVLLVPDVSGEITTAQVKFQGIEPKTLTAEMSAYLNHLSAGGKHIGNMNLSGAMVNGKASTFAEINSPAGYVYAQSQLLLNTPLAYEATLMVRKLNARPLTGATKTPITNVNADVWLKGSGVSLEEVASEAKLTVFPSQVGATSISQGEFIARLRDGQFTMEKGLLRANDTTVDVHGRLGVLHNNMKGKIAYSLAAKNITPWLALGGVEGKGAIDLTGVAEGALTALQVNGKLALTNIAVSANELRDGTITYQFANLGGSLPQGRVSLVANEVRVGKLFRSVDADINLTGLQPANVQAEVTVHESESRTHHLKTQMRYAPEQMDVVIQDLTLQLPSGAWTTPPTPHFTLRGSTYSIENFVLQHEEQRISAGGVIDQQGPLNFQLQIDRLAVADLRPFLGEAPEMQGQLNANVKLLGSWVNPDVTASVATGAVTVAGQTYAGLSAQGSYQGERLAVNALLRQDEAHSLRMEGGLPITLKPGENPLLGDANVHIHSDGLSLAFLELLSRDITEVRGAVTMDVALNGPVQMLAPSGQIRLQQGHVHIKQLGQTFSDVNMDVQLEQQRIRLSQLSIRSGEGQLTGNGVIALNQYQIGDIDLTFAVQRFRVINTREYRAALSGQVRGAGSLERPTIAGDLVVVDTTLRPDLALLKGGPAAIDSTITVVQSTEELHAPVQDAAGKGEKEGEPNGVAQNGFYQNLALDVGVTIPRDTWVHMSEGSIELMGKLRAQKAPQDELTLTGIVETVRGWIAVQGRKFQLEKGVVTFTGGAPIDPSLDIVARYTLPDYLVDVEVGGSSTSPTVAFRSEPALEQADILSLLVFGKPANALDDKQKTSLQSQAVQALAGTVASDLRQALAEELGIEDLELDVGDDATQSKVGIGKYIAPGVFVSTSQQLGGDNAQGRDVTIEYQLNDNWQLKASSTAHGNNGVDILWKKKY